MKKVVHIITGLNDGGAEGVLVRLCLNSPNIEHAVISLMDKGKYGSVLKEAGIRVYCLGMVSGRPSFKRLIQLISLIRSEKPDLVQTWMYHADLLGGVAAKIAGVKRVFWGIRHSTLEKGKAKRSTIAIAKLCAVLSYFVPDKIICCANKALLVHRDFGYASRKLVVIPNGYDLSKFKSDKHSGAELRASFGISPDTFLLGKVGRYDPFKDHDNLLSALKELKLSVLNFRCMLVGRGLTNDNEALMAKINELELIDEVILAGQRTDIPAVMNALDLHVLSSSSEGFPNVLAEAMACGTPSVSTDVGDAGEIVGCPQLLCSPRNPEALGKLILVMHTEWFKKPVDWSGRQAESIQHIKNNFSIDRMVTAYENCWFAN